MDLDAPMTAEERAPGRREGMWWEEDDVRQVRGDGEDDEQRDDEGDALPSEFHDTDAGDRAHDVHASTCRRRHLPDLRIEDEDESHVHGVDVLRRTDGEEHRDVREEALEAQTS